MHNEHVYDKCNSNIKKKTIKFKLSWADFKFNW